MKETNVIRGQLLDLCDHVLSFRLLRSNSTQQFFREQLNVTNTTFSRILKKYCAQNEGDARLFDCVVNVLFFLPLTSVDSCRCDSYCSARFFQNLPAPPKHYGVFDVFADFQSFCEPEKLGSH